MGWADYANEHSLSKEVCIALMDMMDRINYVYLKVNGSYGDLSPVVSDKVKYIEKLLYKEMEKEKAEFKMKVKERCAELERT